MKFLVAFTAVVAVAVAGPTHRLVEAGIAGPAPIIIEPEQPISVGPAIVEGASPIVVGPAIVDQMPISVGPAIVEGTSPIAVGPAIVEGTSPIAVGPAIVDQMPISVGPAIVEGTSPISVGPAIVEHTPIAVGPAILDFPQPDGGALTEVPAAAMPVPVDLAPVHHPRISMTININPAALGSNLVAVEGLPAASAPVAPEAVSVVETAPEVVSVVDTAPIVDPVVVQPAPTPVEVVDNAPSSPITVVDNTPSAPVTVVDNSPSSPITVVDTAPIPVGVVEVAPTPVQVIETPVGNPSPVVIEPALVDSESTSEGGITNITNNFLVNVILNFIQGERPEVIPPVQASPGQTLIPVFPDAVSVVNN